MFIAIAGLVGSGKTTVTKEIMASGRVKNLVSLEEDVHSNPFVEAYSSTWPAKAKSFEIASMQLNFMHQRFFAYSKITNNKNPEIRYITDRTLSEDFWIYLLDQIIYKDISFFHAIPNLIAYFQSLFIFKKPTHIVILNASREVLLERIAKRYKTRGFERYINDELVERWLKRYDYWQLKIAPAFGVKVLYLHTDFMSPKTISEKICDWLDENG